ncbi:MAG: hypothetical protein AB1801_19125, partial [Chloroflexota bacterium]
QVSGVVIFSAILYFVIVFAIGYVTRKASVNPMDYYVAGRKVGAVVNGAALAATYFSPASFLGLPAFIFLLGYPFWWALIGIIGGLPLAAMLTAAPLRKYAPVSFTDYYADRYESPKAMRIIAGLPTLFSGWAYVVLSLVGTGLFMMAILRIDYQLSVVLGAIAVLFYVYMGGMVATTWSTAFQGLLMSIAAVVGAFTILAHYGGFGALADAVHANNPNFWLMPHAQEASSHPLMSYWTGVVSFYFIWHYGFATMPYTVVRFFTAMNIASARRAVFWAVVFGGSMYWGLIIIGTAARALIETLHPYVGELMADGTTVVKTAVNVLAYIKAMFGVRGAAVTDYSMIAALESLGQPVIMGILVAGGLAIAMATAAGWVMVLNVLIGRDFMGKCLGNKWAIENPVKSLRIWTVAILAFGTIFALNPAALVLDLSGWGFVVIICTVGAPLVLGLWWRRATTMAAYITILTFLPLSIWAWLYARNVLGSPHWAVWGEALFGRKIPVAHQWWLVPASFIFFIIVSYLTKPCSPETIKKYVDDLH